MRTVTKSEGERVRIRHMVDRLRALLTGLEATLGEDEPPSPDVGQAVARAGVDVACALARLGAYMRDEQERALADALQSIPPSKAR